LLILVFDARRIPPRRAGACNTLKEPAGGLWGILNKWMQPATMVMNKWMQPATTLTNLWMHPSGNEVEEEVDAATGEGTDEQVDATGDDGGEPVDASGDDIDEQVDAATGEGTDELNAGNHEGNIGNDFDEGDDGNVCNDGNNRFVCTIVNHPGPCGWKIAHQCICEDYEVPIQCKVNVNESCLHLVHPECMMLWERSSSAIIPFVAVQFGMSHASPSIQKILQE